MLRKRVGPKRDEEAAQLYYHDFCYLPDIIQMIK